jgi:hypothetical protein
MILSLDFDGVLHPQYEKQLVPTDVAFCNLPRFEAVMLIWQIFLKQPKKWRV